VRLNHWCELDGRDANGYDSIAWAIAASLIVHGIQVFGKIHYTSFAGTSRKFDSRAYIEK